MASEFTLTKETAEVSSADNWVSTVLNEVDIEFYAYEGYTIAAAEVTAVFDRRRTEDISDVGEDALHEAFLNEVGNQTLEAKLNVAALLDIPYFIALYDDSNVGVYELSDDSARFETKFSSYEAFGEWTMQFRDRDMDKGFEHDSNLPQFDKQLRKAGYPWPGNLDSVWVEDGDVRAIIEFQTTNVTAVRKHSNNKYFSADTQRWKVIDLVAQQLGRPIVIIVWSPNAEDTDVRLKKVEEITYSGRGKGLRYETDQVIPNAQQKDPIELVNALRDLV